MKELTIEEKAKRYDKALERMKSWVRGEHPECFTEAKKAAEFIFPELKESEGEKIRKAIIEHFEGSHSSMYPYKGFTKKEILAWLEKQGEQKPQGKSALEAIKEEKVDNTNKVEPEDYNSIDPHFGKPISKVEPKKVTCTQEVEIGNGNIKALVTEEIPIDKIKPKFHEGEWVTIKE